MHLDMRNTRTLECIAMNANAAMPLDQEIRSPKNYHWVPCCSIGRVIMIRE